MRALVLLALLVQLAVFQTTVHSRVPVKSGYAVSYDRGRMERVAAIRDLELRQDTHGYAANVDCWRIGQVVVVSLNGRGPFRLLIADCSDPTKRRQRNGRYESDRDRHLRTGLIVETDYNVAQRAGFANEGRVKATIWFYESTPSR